jgi:hypothetical protein
MGPTLVVVVLGVVKELVLECQRYQADNQANSRTIEHIKSAKPLSEEGEDSGDASRP